MATTTNEVAASDQEPEAPREATTAEEPVADPDEPRVVEDAENLATSPRAPIWAGFFAGMSVLLIALLIAGTVAYLRVRSNDQVEQRNRTVVATARQEVLNLTTLDYRNAGDDIDQILVMATGTFQKQFSMSSSGFRAVLEQGHVVSNGQVTEAGVISQSATSAQVLVAARATVTNTSNKGENRIYRMKVSLAQSGGDWRVSDVEFVA